MDAKWSTNQKRSPDGDEMVLARATAARCAEYREYYPFDLSEGQSIGVRIVNGSLKFYLG